MVIFISTDVSGKFPFSFYYFLLYDISKQQWQQWKQWKNIGKKEHNVFVLEHIKKCFLI